jgi:thioredoxin 1
MRTTEGKLMLRPITFASLCAVLLMIGVGCAKKTTQTNAPPAPANTVLSEAPARPTTDGNAATAANVPSAESERGKPNPKDDVTDPAKEPAQHPSVKTNNGQESPQKQTPAAKDGLLPRVVDLGRGTCIPCKQMAPILAELQTELKGKATVEVIDLRDDPEAGDRYGIRLIPTQIFFDTKGKETWRHEGFLPKDDITAKLKEAGMKE